MRLELVLNSDRRSAVLVLDAAATTDDVLRAACNKFRMNPRKCRLFTRGAEAQPTDTFTDGASVWLLNTKETYAGPNKEQFSADDAARDCVTILDGADVWIDPEAVEQVHQAVRSSAGGIVRAIGLPDLHHGPTGVAILARTPMPKLPGYDIGCGMALFPTRIPATIARDRVARCMGRLDLDVGEHPEDPQLGTLGGGNHFAELLVLDPAVPLAGELVELLDPGRALLLVHSGSRAHGQRVFQQHADGHDPEGYMTEHEALVGWARRNRAEIARRFLQQFSAVGGGAESAAGAHLEQDGHGPNQQAHGSTGGPESGEPGGCLDGCAPTPLIDIAHNWIERLPGGMFLHRKGAAPSHPGSLSLLPGSRATASYVLVCDGSLDRDLFSVAHGAGRRLSRADARRRGPAGGGDLTRGGTVVCESKELLLEEAPAAYKDVDAVVACMSERGMCQVGARLLPIATYKTRTP